MQVKTNSKNTDFETGIRVQPLDLSRPGLGTWSALLVNTMGQSWGGWSEDCRWHMQKDALSVELRVQGPWVLHETAGAGYGRNSGKNQA